MNAGRPQLRFHETERAFTVDFTEHIDDHIRKVNEALIAGLEAATLTLIVEHLRSKGYVVIEPAPEANT